MYTHISIYLYIYLSVSLHLTIYIYIHIYMRTAISRSVVVDMGASSVPPRTRNLPDAVALMPRIPRHKIVLVGACALRGSVSG